MKYSHMKMSFFGTLFLVFSTFSGFSQDFMMQGWYWDYPKPCNGASQNWTQTLSSQASTIGDAGFNYLWLPPLSRASFGACSNGYDPKDLYDLGEYGLGPTGFGTRAEVDALLTTLSLEGVHAVADVVYNHRDGGLPENNPAVKSYITTHYHSDKNPFPSDRFRCVLPIGGSTGLGAGDYYVKVSSKTGASKFSNKPYTFYVETNVVGWQNAPDLSETEPNGGGDCGESNESMPLGVNMSALVETNGCMTDEFHIHLDAGDFNSAGDSLFIYLTNSNGDYSDHRVYGIWSSPANADIVNQLSYQTYTDFTTLPSGQGGMNYENFKPNSSNTSTTYLGGDWDWLWFFYDYDQSQNDTKTKLFQWTEWLLGQVGLQGLRMDAVKHFDPVFVAELMNYLHGQGIVPPLVVGEFYDGNPNLLKGWVDDVTSNMTTGAQAAIPIRTFDFALRHSLKEACDAFGYDVRNVFQSGMVDGVGANGFNTITFVNNHDFREPGHPVQNDPMLAYAYILTNNQVGMPSVFYPDYFGTTIPNAPTGYLKPKIDSLIDIHKNFIYQSNQVDYLSRYNTPYANNYLSANATENTTLLYQLSGGIGGQEVIVCINFSGDTLKVDHEINNSNSQPGDKFYDHLGYSSFPYAEVNGSNQIYIQLPPRSYSVWVQSQQPLPVTLVDFSAKKIGSNAILKWHSSQEINVSDYEIQRSVDGIDFKTIGRLSAKNSSNVSYEYIDYLNETHATTYYYRLKMNDLDGHFDYSDQVAVRIKSNEFSYSLAQNPITHSLKIHLNGPTKEGFDVTLFNSIGQIIPLGQKQNPEEQQVLTIDFSNQPAGMYYVRIRNNGEYHYESVLKM